MTREELKYVLNNLKVDKKYIGRLAPFKKDCLNWDSYFRLTFDEALTLAEDYLVVNICTTDGYEVGTTTCFIIDYKDLFVYIDKHAYTQDEDTKAICLSTYDSYPIMFNCGLGCVDKDFKIPKVEESIDD